MIFIKKALTREKFIDLLTYSVSPECQFVVKFNPGGKDPVFKKGSVIKLLKFNEVFFVEEDVKGDSDMSYRVDIELSVEERYYEQRNDPKYPNAVPKKCLSGLVPLEVHLRVCQILFG